MIILQMGKNKWLFYQTTVGSITQDGPGPWNIIPAGNFFFSQITLFQSSTRVKSWYGNSIRLTHRYYIQSNVPGKYRE